MQPASPALEPGTLLGGKFRIVRLLGAGGMGAVYEIRHEITKHRRAMKLVHAGALAQPEAVARFLREASAAGRIGDPHIVETFDAGTLESGQPYLVLEYLEGRTLAERIREGALPVDVLADLVCQAALGVHAAHEAGIIHRDLKPENLFVVPRPEGDFVKVLDFGISLFDEDKTGEKRMTQKGALMGTPLYMSPEQVRGTALDRRSDVYALGVILYEAASGVPPFDGDVLHGVLMKIVEGDARRLDEIRGDLPEGFAALVHRAFAVDREHRFADAGALADALEAFRRPASPGATPPVLAPSVAPSPIRAPAIATSTPPPPLTVGGPAPSGQEGEPLQVTGLTGLAGASSARSSGVRWAIASLALAGLAGVAVLMLRPPTAVTSLAVAPSASASAAEPGPVVRVSAPPSTVTVTPAIASSAPSAAAPVTPAPSASAAPRSPATPAHSSAPVRPSSPSRVDQQHLAKEHPI